jgi:hypothetical protein
MNREITWREETEASRDRWRGRAMFLTTKVARKDRQIARMRREIRDLRADLSFAATAEPL